MLGVIAGLPFVFAACGSAGSVFPYRYDNGEDYFSDGLQRIVDKEGRIGFRDSVGKIVITPRYAFAFPFKDGFAKVTDTGHREAVDTWMISMPAYGPIIEPALQKSYSTDDMLK